MEDLIDMLRKASAKADDSSESQRYEDAADALESQAREIDRLSTKLRTALLDSSELATLKAQPSGVVDAQRLLDWNRSQPEPRPIVVGREYQVAEACAHLNQPASGGDERAADELHANAELCAFVLRQIASMESDEIDGDDIDLRFEDLNGADTGCDVSIVDYAGKAADVIESLLARAALPGREAVAEGWIQVSERLPDRDQGTVAVLTEEGDTLTAWASYWSGASDAFASWTFPHMDDDDSIVTHWMQLPAAPSPSREGE